MTNLNSKTFVLFVCFLLLLAAGGCDLGTYEKRRQENRSTETEFVAFFALDVAGLESTLTGRKMNPAPSSWAIAR